MLSWMVVSLHSRCAGSINLHTKHWDCMCSLLQGSTEQKYFIHNHLSFKVQYHNDGVSETSRIVGFDVTPYRCAFVVCVGSDFSTEMFVTCDFHRIVAWISQGHWKKSCCYWHSFFSPLRSHLLKKLTSTDWSYWDTHCSGNTAASMLAWIVWQVYM
jgi:hypothetical protein